MKVNTIIWVYAGHSPQFTMGRYMLHILTLGELVNLMAYFSTAFAWKLRAKHMKRYVTFSEAALKSAIATP